MQPMDEEKWVFKTTQNDDLIAEAVIEHMTKTGVKDGFIGFNDPMARTGTRCFSAMAEKAGLKIIANERFTRTDQSVTGQALKLLAAKPDAVFIAATGGPTVPPHATLPREGLQGQALPDARRRHQRFHPPRRRQVEGTLMAGGLMLVADDPASREPDRGVAQGYIKATRSEVGAGKHLDLRCQHLRRRPAARQGDPEALKKASRARPSSAPHCVTRWRRRRKWSAHRVCST